MARTQGFDCPVGCAGLWSTHEYRDEHIRRCHPERVTQAPADPMRDLPLFAKQEGADHGKPE